MSADQASPADVARPPDEVPAAALPLNPRDGIAGVPVARERDSLASLTVAPLPRTIAHLALPAVASMLLMTLFATADAFWIGTRIGAAGLAAVSTSIFWIWMLIACAELVSVGLTAVASRRHGERRPAEAARAVGDTLLFALALGAALGLAGWLSRDAMFGVMHTPAEVTALGKRYLGTYLLGAPLIFGFFALDAAFRASGDTRTPFVLLGVSVSLALALDPVLIVGLGPAPALGIAGAAVATIATRGLAFTAGVALLARRGLVRLGAPHARTILAVVRIGLPTALTGVVFSLIYVALTRITTRFGTPALAALGVGHRVESWSYLIGVGFAAATAAIVGQSLGARMPERATRAGWLATGYATLAGTAAAIVLLTLAHPLAAIFTHDAAVIDEGAHYLQVASLASLFMGAELVLEGALGGAGATLPPMLTSTTITAARVPLAAWAAVRWGTTGIWWVISLTAVGRGVAMMALWRSGFWKRTSS
ncbi:MAG TPA: MATE family efflux transporter [Gemmatimonadaceae bacterium]|nr:MATE family efflux transporter [Gemmatimonadaceae bacterium]